MLVMVLLPSIGYALGQRGLQLANQPKFLIGSSDDSTSRATAEKSSLDRQTVQLETGTPTAKSTAEMGLVESPGLKEEDIPLVKAEYLAPATCFTEYDIKNCKVTAVMIDHTSTNSFGVLFVIESNELPAPCTFAIRMVYGGKYWESTAKYIINFDQIPAADLLIDAFYNDRYVTITPYWPNRPKDRSEKPGRTSSYLVNLQAAFQ